YLIISASKATEPILAIIDSGNYQEDEQVNVEGFDFFMENALNYVATADGVTGSNDEGPDDKIMTWYNDTVVLVHPVLPYKVNVKWGQKWPENVYCPNKIAGCAPVAIAQLLSYFKPEMSFDVTFEGRPCDHMTIDWNEILKHKTSYNSIERPFFDPVACQGCTVAHEQLAVLLRQIGVWAHSTYEFDIDNNPTVTSTDIGYLYSVTDMLLPNCMKSFVDTGRIYDDMGEGIALVTGVTINESNTLESHAWIIDGKGSITYRITLYTYYNPKTGEYATREFKSETAKYLHCNWGWRGVYNGYFLENAFNTNSGRDFPIVVPVGPVTLGANTISSRSTYLGVYGYAYH
ncbi:MAG: C10 family peptidase, partial [Muribaculaceae bacterium]|nr:C10 family peptidase [Muribaculaceae bacterium]